MTTTQTAFVAGVAPITSAFATTAIAAWAATAALAADATERVCPATTAPSSFVFFWALLDGLFDPEECAANRRKISRKI
jgi:hypothetical protein